MLIDLGTSVRKQRTPNIKFAIFPIELIKPKAKIVAHHYQSELFFVVLNPIQIISNLNEIPVY